MGVNACQTQIVLRIVVLLLVVSVPDQEQVHKLERQDADSHLEV